RASLDGQRGAAGQGEGSGGLDLSRLPRDVTATVIDKAVPAGAGTAFQHIDDAAHALLDAERGAAPAHIGTHPARRHRQHGHAPAAERGGEAARLRDNALSAALLAL